MATQKNTPKKKTVLPAPVKQPLKKWEPTREEPVAQQKLGMAEKQKANPRTVTMPFSRMNYLLLFLGIGLIVFGFWLMSRDKFIDATQFSVSLHIAPIVVIAGFIEIIFAIMYRSPAAPETV